MKPINAQQTSLASARVDVVSGGAYTASDNARAKKEVWPRENSPIQGITLFRGVRHLWKSRTLAQKSLEITTEIIGNQEIRLHARNLE